MVGYLPSKCVKSTFLKATFQLPVLHHHCSVQCSKSYSFVSANLKREPTQLLYCAPPIALCPMQTEWKCHGRISRKPRASPPPLPWNTQLALITEWTTWTLPLCCTIWCWCDGIQCHIGSIFRYITGILGPPGTECCDRITVAVTVSRDSSLISEQPAQQITSLHFVSMHIFTSNTVNSTISNNNKKGSSNAPTLSIMVMQWHFWLLTIQCIETFWEILLGDKSNHIKSIWI